MKFMGLIQENVNNIVYENIILYMFILKIQIQRNIKIKVFFFRIMYIINVCFDNK